MIRKIPCIKVFHLSWVDSIAGIHLKTMLACNLRGIIKSKLQRVEFLLAFSLCILCCWTSAIAGIIKIETDISATVRGNVLKVKVRVTNKGSETAYNAKVHLSSLGGEQGSSVIHHLDKDQGRKLNFEKLIAEGKDGSYPLTVIVTFHDANQYPFSAVSCSTFSFKKNVEPDLVCFGNDISIGNKGVLRFNLKNLSFESRPILATVIVPRELSVARPKMNFEIPPRSEKAVEFEIVNFAALEGASHAVFCYFEYDADTTHYTAVAGARVTITSEENFFGRKKCVWIALILVLTIILFITLVRDSRSKKSKAKRGPQ